MRETNRFFVIGTKVHNDLTIPHDQLIIPQPAFISSPFKESTVSFPFSQELATGSYHDGDYRNSLTHTLSLGDILIIFFNRSHDLARNLFTSHPLTETPYLTVVAPNYCLILATDIYN
jgi:hypothetical protein